MIKKIFLFFIIFISTCNLANSAAQKNELASKFKPNISINNKSSKKIWPEKKKDINFIILESTISDGTTYLKIPSVVMVVVVVVI